jgi:chromosome segregation ATPase
VESEKPLAHQLPKQKRREPGRKLLKSAWVLWIRRHGNHISIVAAFFALFSQALKDLASENFKDTVLSLEKIEDESDRRNDIEQLNNKLDTILGQTAPQKSEGEKLTVRQARLRHIVAVQQAQLEQIDLLMNALGTNIKNDVDTRHKVEDAYDDTRLKVEKFDSTANEEFDNIKGELQTLEYQIQDFGRDLRKRLATKTQDARKWRDICGAVNFYIFPIGIMLAVLGQVAKAKTDVGA